MSECCCDRGPKGEEPNVRIIGAVPKRAEETDAVREAYAPAREAIEELREAARKRQKKKKK